MTHRYRTIDAAGFPDLTPRLDPLFRACFGAAPWFESEQRLAALPARMAWMALRPGAHAELAEDGANLAGAAIAWPMPESFPVDNADLQAVAAAAPDELLSRLVAPALLVAKLMVAPAHRRRGVARTLMTRIVPPGTPAWLSTHPDAPAAQVYDALGWCRRLRYEVDGSPLLLYTAPDP